MSTLADELLQDFEDSGSEHGDEQNDLGLDGDSSNGLANGDSKNDDDEMVLDGDEEPPEEDDEMGGLNGAAIDPMDDEDEAKAKVEKLQLGNVKDIRKVTTVMDRLEPLLKVSRSGHSPHYNSELSMTPIMFLSLTKIFRTLRTTSHNLSMPRP